MTALSLDDLAALERTADRAVNLWAGEPLGRPVTIEANDLLSLISQLRAAMEVIGTAEYLQSVRQTVKFDCVQMWDAVNDLNASVIAYREATGATAS